METLLISPTVNMYITNIIKGTIARLMTTNRHTDTYPKWDDSRWLRVDKVPLPQQRPVEVTGVIEVK